MKKIIFAAALALSSLSIKHADAQIKFHVNLNIGSQPEWGPVGYDHADYYYMPDIDAYYSVPTHQYVYQQNNAWIHSNALPPRYANYDVYHGYKVVVNQENPWNHHAQIRNRYANYRNRHDQAIIRDSRDDRYRNHWHEDHGHGDHGHDDHGRHDDRH